MNGLKHHSNSVKNGHGPVKEKKREFLESFEEPPYFTAITTYFIYIVLNIVGRVRDFLRKCGFDRNVTACPSLKTKDFVPLYQDYESFYTRHVYRRIRDCWNRPICSVPGSTIDLVDRISDDHNWTFKNLNSSKTVMNFGSYNYLGYAENEGVVSDEVKSTIEDFGIGICSSRQEVGNLEMHRQLERLTAEFTGQEDAMVFPMGFATNALNIPILVDKHSCVISDMMNHTSLILGIRMSGAHIKRFHHNNMWSLEREIRKAILYGHPRTRRAFNKLLVIVEGIYSMEGSIVRLPEIVQLKKKYGFQLYLDEAHSIGAIGSRGRGIADYFEIDPRDVDVAMGTFTKSFAGAGGYISGSSRLISYMREMSHGSVYGSVGAMSPPVTQQIMGSMRQLIYSPLGKSRIDQLAANTRYFRASLSKMGFIVFGNRDSPVVPVIICKPTGLAAFSRQCIELGVGTVVVGFPATKIILARARFCMSSSHTREMIDEALKVIQKVGYNIAIKYSRCGPPKWYNDIESSTILFSKEKQSKITN